LRLAPAGDLVVGTEGGITTAPQAVQRTAFVDVPTALVLRVKTSDWTENIVVSPTEKAGVEIGGQSLTLAGPLTLYAVLPLTARGEPGRGELALRASSAGRRAKIPLVIDVRSYGRLIGSVRQAEGDPPGAPAVASCVRSFSDRRRLDAEDLETVPDLAVDLRGNLGRLRLVDDLSGPLPGTVEDVAMPIVRNGCHAGPLLA
jgi:hypothetical protein